MTPLKCRFLGLHPTTRHTSGGGGGRGSGFSEKGSSLHLHVYDSLRLPPSSRWSLPSIFNSYEYQIGICFLHKINKHGNSHWHGLARPTWGSCWGLSGVHALLHHSPVQAHARHCRSYWKIVQIPSGGDSEHLEHCRWRHGQGPPEHWHSTHVPWANTSSALVP